MIDEKEKKAYREWSEELFFERPDRPIYHGDGTISFVTNCDHIIRGIVVLLAPNSKEPWVFCANCGGWITTLKLWQEWDQEHREIYKDPWRPKIQFSFSTADQCLGSFWDSEPMKGQLIDLVWLDPPIRKAQGLFRNLGKKITQAILESEEKAWPWRDIDIKFNVVNSEDDPRIYRLDGKIIWG